jgi:monoamine oxidase
MAADRVDAIVVGGGLAGVTAARDLAHCGFDTVLVEARDRLGGRTEVQTIAGREVDTGGTYFHWFQAAIWREVMRYELQVVESALTFADTYLVGGGDGVAQMPASEFDERLRRGLSAFWGDPEYQVALPRPFSAHTNSLATKLDARSIESRLRELDLDPLDDRVLRSMFADFGASDEVSLAWVLQRMADGVWSYEAFNALFAIYRLEDGMTGLIDEMVSDGAFQVMLSSPVRAIDHNEAGATVVLDDGTVLLARAVVVATPVNVWKTISFTPPLGQAHEAATQEGVVLPAVSNVVMHVRGVTDPVVMLAPFGAGPFDIMVTHSLLDDGQLLSGFSLTGRVTLTNGHDQLEAALCHALPDAELIDFVGHDWTTDPYSMGGFCSLRPGQWSRFIDVLDRPAGTLFFASSEIAPQFPGMLTGAIESGARAGRRARLALDGSGEAAASG